MTLVVDASVAAKWVLAEDGSDWAAVLREQELDLIAPSLVAAEIGNALWKAVLRKDLSATDAAAALNIALGHFARLVPLAELAGDALALSVAHRHSIYDCFYVALAQRERAALATADQRLARLISSLPDVTVRKP